jgi:UDP-glucose 4-epimerase
MSERQRANRGYSWLVTGGAGYIGGHTVRRLVAAGYPVVVFDDLSTGRAERLPRGVPLVVGAVTDRAALVRALRRFGVTGVLHLAARKSVPESVARPAYYYRENVGGLATLLEAMLGTGVDRLVFSSSAAVYGLPGAPVVTESTPTAPINPYGYTKAVCEQLIRDAGVAHGLSWLALRYFNAVGAEAPLLADEGATNLFPRIIQAVTTGEPFVVAGTDFPTRDGTGVRDYVHVSDVADAHLAAVARLTAGPAARTYNVGTGTGHSVLEVLARVRVVAGRQVPYVVGPRRSGDPAEVVAAVDLIRRELGWAPRRDLHEMVESAWRTCPVPSLVGASAPLPAHAP